MWTLTTIVNGKTESIGNYPTLKFMIHQLWYNVLVTRNPKDAVYITGLGRVEVKGGVIHDPANLVLPPDSPRAAIHETVHSVGAV
jgi:hypothetical protein